MSCDCSTLQPRRAQNQQLTKINLCVHLGRVEATADVTSAGCEARGCCGRARRRCLLLLILRSWPRCHVCAVRSVAIVAGRICNYIATWFCLRVAPIGPSRPQSRILPRSVGLRRLSCQQPNQPARLHCRAAPAPPFPQPRLHHVHTQQFSTCKRGRDGLLARSPAIRLAYHPRNA